MRSGLAPFTACQGSCGIVRNGTPTGSVISFNMCLVFTSIPYWWSFCFRFCPTTKYLNKEQTTCNFYSFIRRLKFFEYFHENPNLQDSQHTTNDVERERETARQKDILDWRKRNLGPDWYPNFVKEKWSEGPVSFIEEIISDSNESMKSNQGSFFNNF